MQIDGFDWDAGNLGKCQSHGVSIAEIEAVVSGGFGVFPDLAHSTLEKRLRGIGRNSAGRWVFFAFTLREKDGQSLIRPVSARFMHAREIRDYEEDTARPSDR